MAPRVAIAGGGLAGLTCAKYLVDAGAEVTLFEGLPYLGGRASTYRDEQGDWIEQGLHLFLGTYSEFRRLLGEIGQPEDQTLFWMTELRFQDPAGTDAVYGINPIFSPFRTVLSFLGQNDYLSPIDKLSLLPLVAPALLGQESMRRGYDDRSVTEWWSQVGGTRNTLERFLRPFCRAIQFSEPEDFSAYNFLGWIHGIAYNLPNSLAGGYRGAREEVIFQPLARYLRQGGAAIRVGAPLREILYAPEEGRVTGFVLDRGERVEADLFVVAVPVWAFVPLVPGPLRGHPFFAGLARLPIAPAISVQIWFDRRVVDTPDFYLVARVPIPVYQDQSTNAYPHPGGSRISVIVSPSDEYMDWPDEALVRLTLEGLASVQAKVRSARVTKSVVLKHPKHLVRPFPGVMSARPTQDTPVPNLFLAGDWTQQDFFGSQEGAVRSGKACADAIIRTVASEREGLRGSRPQRHGMGEGPFHVRPEGRLWPVSW